MAAALTVFMYIYLNYSKHGYEIAVVGESQRTASYAGIKVDRVIIRTMVLSGAVCGLMGLLLVAGTDHTLTTTIVGGRGFTAVMVSWMAKFNPIIMIFTSLLLVVLGRGASEISSTFQPEPVLLRHPYRHHPVFHHRQRVLRHLSGQPAQAAERRRHKLCFLILHRSFPGPSCRASPCCTAAPARS